MSTPPETLNDQYYRDYYQYRGERSCMKRIWAEAFGDALPEGLEHYGYLTKDDMEVIAGHLDLPAGSTVLDIGCGKGGPGLRLAEQHDLQLIGIDIIPEAVDQARDFQADFDLKHPPRFEVGQFYDIPLEDASVDAVISIDALWAAPNKIQALTAVKRVMKPGAKFIFTHWDLLSQDPVKLLEISGLKFLWRGETPGWKEKQVRVYEGILAEQDALRAEMGAGANMLLYEAQASPEYLDLSVRRVYVFRL